MSARPTVWLLTAALLLAAGGLLRLALGAGEPAASPAPATASAPLRGDAEPPEAAAASRDEEHAAPARSTGAPAAEPASRVPHQVVLRSGGDPSARGAVEHRMLVLAVDPHLPTDALERLLRDLRERHREAAVLDVRVYDSAELAAPDRERYRREGGALRARHRIAEMRRNDRLGLDVVRVRGVEIEL